MKPNMPNKSMTLDMESQHSARQMFLSHAQSAFNNKETVFTFIGKGGKESQTLTWKQLNGRANAIANELLFTYALKSGDRVLLVYPPSLDFIEALLGCFYAGIIAVPVALPDHRGMSIINKIALDCQPALVLTNAEYNVYRLTSQKSKKTAHIHEHSEISLPWVVPQSDTYDHFNPEIKQTTDIAFLQYTSGSTSHPKGVCVSWRNLLHQLNFNKKHTHLSFSSKMVMWIPHFHDLGLIGGILSCIYGIGSLWFMSPLTFLRNPTIWMELIHQVRATHTAAPDFAYKLITQKTTQEQRQQWDLSCLKLCLNGAEPIQASTVNDFIDAFKCSKLNPNVTTPSYGLAEHTISVTLNGKQKIHINKEKLRQKKIVFTNFNDKKSHTLVGCGAILDDIEVIIINPETLSYCHTNEVGEIWINSPSKASGYWNMPNLSSEIFKAKVNNDTSDKTYLRTGDLGFIYNNELFITGRLKDLMIINGKNIYPQDIEYSVEKYHTEVKPNKIIAFSTKENEEDILNVALEVYNKINTEAERHQLIKSIKSLIWKQESVSVGRIIFMARGGIPKTTSGKVQRQACKNAFEKDEVEYLSLWENILSKVQPHSKTKKNDSNFSYSTIFYREKDIAKWIQERISHTLNCQPEDILCETDFYEYNLDSIASLQLLDEIEKIFNFPISPDLFFEYTNISSVAKYLYEKQNKENKYKEHHYDLSINENIIYKMNEELSSSTYNISLFVKIKKALNEDKIKNNIEQLVRNNGILRSNYTSKHGKVSRIIREEIKDYISYHDTSKLSESEKTKKQNILITKSHEKEFKIKTSNLLHFDIIKKSTKEYLILISIHHIISDFNSLSIMINYILQENEDGDIAEYNYTDDYIDYVKNEKMRYVSKDSIRNVLYWDSILNNHDRYEKYRFNGDFCNDENVCLEKRYSISNELIIPLIQFSKEKNILYSTLLLSIYQISLMIVTGKKSIYLRLPFNNRHKLASKSMQGYLAYGVPCFTNILENDTIGDVLMYNNKNILNQSYFYDFQIDSMIYNPDMSIPKPTFEFNYINTDIISENNIEVLESSYKKDKMWSRKYYSVDFSLSNIKEHDSLGVNICYRKKFVPINFINLFSKVYNKVFNSIMSSQSMPFKEFKKLMIESEENEQHEKRNR